MLLSDFTLVNETEIRNYLVSLYTDTLPRNGSELEKSDSQSAEAYSALPLFFRSKTNQYYKQDNCSM